MTLRAVLRAAAPCAGLASVARAVGTRPAGWMWPESEVVWIG
ncbi:MAG: hypothetical protein ACJARS_003209 [bacterium]|jgi:hypothetical protein